MAASPIRAQLNLLVPFIRFWRNQIIHVRLLTNEEKKRAFFQLRAAFYSSPIRGSQRVELRWNSNSRWLSLIGGAETWYSLNVIGNWGISSHALALKKVDFHALHRTELCAITHKRLGYVCVYILLFWEASKALTPRENWSDFMPEISSSRRGTSKANLTSLRE